MFSNRESVLLLLSTSFANSSKESPALPRRLERNAPKSFISQIFPRFPKWCKKVALRLNVSHFFIIEEEKDGTGGARKTMMAAPLCLLMLKLVVVVALSGGS